MKTFIQKLKSSSFLPLTILLILNFDLPAQEKGGLFKRYVSSIINDTTENARPRFIAYPTLGYAPETDWEIGLSSLYVYYAKRDTTNRLSEISGFTFFTLESQYGLWFDHALYSDRNEWFFLGRVRYQSFPLLFHGIGPYTPTEHLAQVNANSFQVKERVLRKITGSFYSGIEFDLQHLSSVDFIQADPEDPIDIPRGGNGSINFGIGLGILYDNRHNVLNVRDGMFNELAFLHYNRDLGSDFTFTTLISDNRIYRPVNKRDVIAAQLFGQFTISEEAPFNQLALLGGESLMRGYYLGRYRDNNMLAGQVEYRFLPFSFLKRWGAAAFMSTGQVFGSTHNLAWNRFLLAGGCGIRFLIFPKKDIYTRFDVAFTREGPGLYFFIGEAF